MLGLLVLSILALRPAYAQDVPAGTPALCRIGVDVEDLSLGGPQTLAYPKDPQTETVRNGSRLNQVVLIRLVEQELSDAQTQAGSAPTDPEER